MKQNSIFIKFLIGVASLVVPSEGLSGEIQDLRCEYIINPIDVDAAFPRFTWTVTELLPQGFEVRIATDSITLQSDRSVIWNKKTDPTRRYARYDGKLPLRPHTRYYWQVIAVDSLGEKVYSPVSSFTTAKFSNDDWHALWITDKEDMETEGAPMLRKVFEVMPGIKDARIYVTSAGYNEIRINGKRIDDTHMNPGYTHFDKRLLYDVVDVTKYLKPGKNVITAVLGNGFYNCQSKAVWNFENARWRNRPRLLCEIIATDKSGKKRCILKSDKTWQTTTGPYTYNNIYSGDRYDGRLSVKGWEEAEADDFPWEKAMEVEAPARVLQSQMMPPIRSVETIAPHLVKSWGDTVFVFDMGKILPG